MSDQHPLSDYISALGTTSEGKILVGYADGAGFSEYDPFTASFKHYFLGLSQPNASVEAFLDAGEHGIYIAVAGAGVFVLGKTTQDLSQIDPARESAAPLSIQDPTDLVLLDSGRLLITTYQSGAYLYDPDLNLLAPHALATATGEDVNIEIYTGHEDRDGNHWFGTSGGIAIVSKDGRTNWLTSFSTSIPNDQILDIYESRSGMIWVGTFNGLAEATPTLFQVFNETDGLPNNNVNSVTVRNESEWWVGTERGLTVLAASRDSAGDWNVTNVVAELLPEYTIMSLAHDEQHVWAGSLRSGLFRIDVTDFSIVRYAQKRTSAGSISDNGVTSILPYSDNTVLVGTYGGGLNVLDVASGQFESYRREAGDTTSISDDRVIAIASDKSGDVWIGTQNGLNRFEPSTGSFERFTFDAGDLSTISSPVILSLIEDSRGNLWIGTRSGGLNLWRDTNRDEDYAFFEQYDLGGELPSADIYGIVEGPEGELWVTHNAGLSRIDPATREVTNFDESNGLQGREFNHGAAYRASTDKLMFGGPFGFNVIDPTREFADTYEPRLNLISIKRLNEQIFFPEPYTALSKIELENNYQFLSIEFAALDFRRPETTQYRYRISGLQNEWIDLGNTRQVTLSGVPHGDYMLRIQGTNASGRWSSDEISLQVNIAPPIWLTWYAYVAYALVVTLFAGAVWRRQHQKTELELLRRRELEDRVAERTADLQEARTEAEQAAKAKSDFLAAMSHEIRTPMHGMLGMTELLLQSDLNQQQSQLASAAKSSGMALLELVDSILDYSKAEAKKLELHESEFSPFDVVDDVCYLLSERARESGTVMAPVWEKAQFARVVADAGKVRQVLLNLVGNAIKFTRNGEVEVRCSVTSTDNDSDEALLRISVIDSGIGISTEKLDTIFDVFTQADVSTTRKYGGTGLGLAISKELCELMGGDISVSSTSGKGSTFTVNLPVFPASAQAKVKRRGVITAYGPQDLLMRSIASKAELSGFVVKHCEVATESGLDGSGQTEGPTLVHYSLFESSWGTTNAQSVPENSIVVAPHSQKQVLNGLNVVTPPFSIEQLATISGIVQPDLLATSSNDPQQTSGRSQAEETSQEPAFLASVLVVEDVQLNQQIACAMLEPLCRSVDVVSNGEEAVSAVKAKPYQIIFMDCQMPIMDGFEATRAIRAHERENGLSPATIVALTAAHGTADRQRAADSGMDNFLRKPFSRDDLYQVIESSAITRATDATRSTCADTLSEHADELSGDEVPVLDSGVLQNLRSLSAPGETDLIAKLRDGYLEQFAEKVTILGEDSWYGRQKELAKVAHAIKSMSANIGALRVRALAESIEKHPENWDDERIQAHLPILNSLATEFVSALNSELE